MFFPEMDILLYRSTAPATTWGDATFAYHHTISGVVQPFTGDDSLKAGQIFENVRDLITLNLNTDVLKEDVLYYNNDYHRVQYVQYYRNSVLSHIEVFTTDSQWRPV